MNAPLHTDVLSSHRVAEAVAEACRRIAPSFPLDRFIAVNPHWGWVDAPIDVAAAAVGVLGGARLLATATPQRRPLLADLAGCRDALVEQVSQHCAAHFDAGQARWHAPADDGLFASWRRRIAADRGLQWPHGRDAALTVLTSLADDAPTAIGQALAQLGVPAGGHVWCLTAWLLDLNGWAAACAGRAWQARLAGGDDPALVDLLAIRAAWDAMLAPGLPAAQVAEWARSWLGVPAAIATERAAQARGWWQLTEAEHQTQATLIGALSASTPAKDAVTVPAVQAVFCIDVRSEVLRRALEAVAPQVHTRGFAGFFGLPADHQPLGTDWRQPQLPGLMSAQLTVEEQVRGDDDGRPLAKALTERRRARLRAQAHGEGWRGQPASGFSFVEACGALALLPMLRQSLLSQDRAVPWQAAGLRADERRAVKPRIAGAATVDAAQLAATVLHAMGLTKDFAPLVLLCGHGAQSANNAHAAGLDCGACGGQSGEINARALAALLNDRPVRDALRERGIDLSPGTHVLAGHHNTTTDEVTLFDLDELPSTHAAALAALEEALRVAADAARAERAPGLGLAAMPPAQLARTMRQRANHWAETRPEWALADNCAFIAAPRRRTRDVDLHGRVFLHDYDVEQDAGLAVLQLILSAPMVVAHWINLQYLASTVDPRRHGPGNKLLHNVVGGGIGVFEGNGGDLRIGLPWQSVHDGQRLRHTPLRLSVFVEAPRSAIDTVLASQPTVAQLVDHGWVHLLAIEPDANDLPHFHRRGAGGCWHPVAA